MTPVGTEEATYVAALLIQYLDLPETPLRPSLTDRALAYFLPVIAELQDQPLPNSYGAYLRVKFQKLAQDDQLAVRKSTLWMIANTHAEAVGLCARGTSIKFASSSSNFR